MLGIELVASLEGAAEVALELGTEFPLSDRRLVAHGGLLAALADSVGGAAAISLNEVVTPTIDLRIDYLVLAESDLCAMGELVKNSRTLATVDIDIYDESDTLVVTAQGVYKISGADPIA